MEKVYFLQERKKNGFIKIGRTADLPERTRTLQQGNPHELKKIATIPGCPNIETTIHKDLEAFRFRGEWFEPTDEVLDYIEKIQRVDPEGIINRQLTLFRDNYDCPFCGEQHRHKGKNSRYEADCLPSRRRYRNRKSKDRTIIKV